MLIKLLKLPFTMVSCITKLGCLLLVIGIPVIAIVLYIKYA